MSKTLLLVLAALISASFSSPGLADEIEPGTTFNLRELKRFQVQCLKVEDGQLTVTDTLNLGGAGATGQIKIIKDGWPDKSWAYHFYYGNQWCRTRHANLPAPESCDTSSAARTQLSPTQTNTVRHVMEASETLQTQTKVATASKKTCDEYSETYGAFSLDRGPVGPNKACMVSVRPSNPGAYYRTYTAYESGLFQVFDSFGRGSNSSSTGARSYFFFPRTEKPSYQERPDGNVDINTANGETFTFSKKTGKIVATSAKRYSEADSGELTNPANRGKVEITQPSHGLVLDTGWRLGGPAYEKLDRSSVLIDAAGNRCTIPNSRIFKKTGYDVNINPSDTKLYGIFRELCPALKLN